MPILIREMCSAYIAYRKCFDINERKPNLPEKISEGLVALAFNGHRKKDGKGGDVYISIANKILKAEVKSTTMIDKDSSTISPNYPHYPKQPLIFARYNFDVLEPIYEMHIITEPDYILLHIVKDRKLGYLTLQNKQKVGQRVHLNLTKEVIEQHNLKPIYRGYIKDLLQKEVTKMKLIKKKKLVQSYKRYDLQIKDTHNFVASGIIVHNTNCRLGIALDADENGEMVPTFMAGSHNTRRKQEDTNGNECLYWSPMKYPPVKKMLADLFTLYQKPIVIYGEIYGEDIQDMQYDGPKAFSVFDITIGGKFIMWQNVRELCHQYSIPHVPELYIGTYSPEIVRELTDGLTEVCENPKSKFKGREGVVIKPVIDRTVPILGRVILKSVSADYLARKGGTDGK